MIFFQATVAPQWRQRLVYTWVLARTWGEEGVGEAKLLQPQPPGYLKTKFFKLKHEKDT